MYVDRYWFHHNDSNIAEHYVDNFFRSEVKENVMHRLADIYDRTGHSIEKMSNRIFSCKPTKEDLIKFARDFEWFEQNIAIPMFAIAAIDMGLVKVSLEFHRELRAVMWENMMSNKNVFGFGYDYFYEKYDRPLRLERNKRRNKKLSEWQGRKTTDFSGVESKSINSELNP